jgi:Ca-activated chloride channel family protein
VKIPACAVAAAVAGTILSAQGQRPAFRSGIDLVSFGVTVVDKKGNFITTLAAPDFEVLEDGKKQEIRYFSAADARGAGEGESRSELHLGVLFDISGSMDEDISLSRSAAIKFLNTLTDAVDITVVDFDTEVRIARFGQSDFPRLVERIRSRKPDGLTALYDALGVYLDNASSEKGRKILVLYTDGADNRSNITFSDVRTLLRASDVTVYTIGFLEHLPSSLKLEMRAGLQQIAEMTGGQFFLPSSMKEIEASYEKVKEEIGAQYSLGYLSSNQRADGSWRKVEIKLARPGLKDLRIRTRKGYFAPYRTEGDGSSREPAARR